jgi:hypothetical protein
MYFSRFGTFYKKNLATLDGTKSQSNVKKESAHIMHVCVCVCKKEAILFFSARIHSKKFSQNLRFHFIAAYLWLLSEKSADSRFPSTFYTFRMINYICSVNTLMIPKMSEITLSY